MATKPNKPSNSRMNKPKPKSEDQLWGPAKPFAQKGPVKKRPVSARAASQASRAMVKKENRPAAAMSKTTAKPGRSRAVGADVAGSAQAKAYNKTLKKVKGDATKIPGFTMGRNPY